MKKHIVLEALSAALVLTLAACISPVVNEKTPAASAVEVAAETPADPALERVEKLPAYTGATVSSESEARSLAVAAQGQIQAGIASALLTQSSSSNSRAVNVSGNYSYNGVKVQYTVTSNEGYPLSYPSALKATEKVSINGTYGGYTISGTGLDIQFDASRTSAAMFNFSYTYDCAFTVLYEGKGMKLEQTGTMDIALNGTSVTYDYKLHYRVYDNDNKLLYEFDYVVMT